MIAPILVIVLVVLSLPLLFFLGFFQVISWGFGNLGFPPEAVLITLIAMLVGSFINIPLGRRKLVEVQERRFFGLFSQRKVMAQGLSLNVGGGLIPLLIALFLLPRVPLEPTLLATFIMIVLSWKLARPIPGKGIGVPFLLPPLFAALFAFLLVPEAPALVAFVSGTLGIIIGADILRLPQVMRGEVGMLSVGGAGVFDAVFLTGIIAALLAGL